MSRKAEKVSWYLIKIDKGWPGFRDDGLSGGFPDWIYGRWNLRLAGRVHDWHYCGRCHRAGTMNQAHRKLADRALRQHARELLPWWLSLAPLILYAGVRFGGGGSAWNSCGPDQGELCRHNVPQPDWMLALR